MKISVNLASRPFVELRPLLARLRLAMGVLAVVSVLLGFWVHSLGERARAATARMDAVKAQIAAVNAERARNEARMMQPQNRGVLERSRFLNKLFAEKGFSWTAVMMDLERVLPERVQVTSIEPAISKEGDVSIRLRVTGDRDRTIALVRNLERSQRFANARVAGETALTAERAKALNGAGAGVGLQTVSAAGALAPGNGVEFEIFSGYVPLPETPLPAAGARTAVIHSSRKPAASRPPAQGAPRPSRTGGVR